jgi:integrase
MKRARLQREAIKMGLREAGRRGGVVVYFPAPESGPVRYAPAALPPKPPPLQIEPPPTKPAGPMVSEFFESRYLADSQLKPSTASDYRRSLRLFCDCLGGDRPIDQVTKRGAADYRAWLAAQVAAGKTSAATAQKHLREVKAVLTAAWAEDLCPMQLGTRPIKGAKKKVWAWCADEVVALQRRAVVLEGTIPKQSGTRSADRTPLFDGPPVRANVFWPALLSALPLTGGRITATMLTERRDFDRHGPKHLTLRAENQKDDEELAFWLPDQAVAAIERLLDSHGASRIFPWPFDPPDKVGHYQWKVLGQRFDELIARPAGVRTQPGKRFHIFRRFAATAIRQEGGVEGREASRQQLGHSSATTTDQHYFDPDQAPPLRGAKLVAEAIARAGSNGSHS